ncbi:hypothetical protein Gotur_016098, partial [Gossypium turneri]
MWGNEVGRRISLGRCCRLLFGKTTKWFHLVMVPPPTQKNFGSKSKGFSECFQHGGRWRSINMEVEDDLFTSSCDWRNLDFFELQSSVFTVKLISSSGQLQSFGNFISLCVICLDHWKYHLQHGLELVSIL